MKDIDVNKAAEKICDECYVMVSSSKTAITEDKLHEFFKEKLKDAGLNPSKLGEDKVKKLCDELSSQMKKFEDFTGLGVLKNKKALDKFKKHFSKKSVTSSIKKVFKI